jgi:putative transposase
VQAAGALKLRRNLIEPWPKLSLQRQCELVGISRSGFYYEPAAESPENLALMRRLDQMHLEHPAYGSRRLTALLRREAWQVNRKRVGRLLELMGVQVLYPKRNLSQPGEGHRIYPYLLEGLEISGPDQVWCSDITYVPMADGFMYLVAVMDWWSRYVVAWELSNSLDSEFCIRAWTRAVSGGRSPVIANTDQGSQFTSEAYLDAVESVGVDVSMDGRGRWIDNRFIERLWRSVKQEDVYPQDYGDGLTAQRGLSSWFKAYNTDRPHMALDYATPAEWYHWPESYGARPAAWRWR